MRTEVSIVRADNYESDLVYQRVKEAVNHIGGIERFVRSGQRVLLKPNLLMAKTPDDAVTTHPAVVSAVIRLVLEAGGIPTIGDSSAIGGWNKVISKAGIKEVADQFKIKTAPFKDCFPLERSEKHIFKSLEITDEVKKADVIINLPKLKSHTLMLLTLCVKNIFGCVVGQRKAQWHLNSGTDKMCFARMLLELYEAIAPDLTIMDGIVGMEGNGPSGGDPRQIGLILAGIDCVAMDTVICDILGKKWDYLYTNRAAREKGIGETHIRKIHILGNDIKDVAVDNFNFAVNYEPGKIGRFLIRHLQSHLTRKPVEERSQCTLCGACIDICPPSVISKDSTGLRFNYEKCIRCFCCQEICPEKAMEIKKSLLLRIIS